MKKVHFSDKECEEMLNTLGYLSEQLHEIEDEKIREMITSLMQHFDVIHREGLARLWGFMKKDNPELCVKLNKDYAIHHLLGLYDLENFEGVEEAVDIKGFIASDDIDIINDK